MSWIDAVRARVHLLFGRRAVDARLAAEVRLHIEMESERLVRDEALSPVEARRRAIVAFGGIEARKEELRDGRGFAGVRRLTGDLHRALRRVRARPAASALAVGMLALAIGLSTAMATIVDALVIRRVPFTEPEQLTMLYARGERGGRLAFALPVVGAWRSNPGFTHVEGATVRTDVTVDTPGSPLVLKSATVTAGLFPMLGVTASRGRLFSDDEGRSGTDDRILVSEDVWRSITGERGFTPGTTITVNEQRLHVIGLLPRGFRFPDWNTTLWRPMDATAPPAPLAREHAYVYVRFAPNAPRADALTVATREMDGLDPLVARMRVMERPIAGSEPDEFVRAAFPVISVAIALLFLVLSANVASLLLAQFTARRREFGMCSALGASRGRLLGEAFFEGATLAAGGVVFGVVLAWALVSVARGLLPAALLEGTLNTVELDGRALAAAVTCGVVATVVAGLLPAWIGTRLDPAEATRGAGRASTESRAARLTTRTLLVTEIALTCMLLTGATLLVRSFVTISMASRGLDLDGVVTTWVDLDTAAYRTPEDRRLAAQSVEDAARAIPGVTKVALSFGAPPGGGSLHFGDGWRSDVADTGPIEMTVDSYAVGADFFDLYGIPLLAGRRFTATDTDRDVIVGERLSRVLWPGHNPVGRTFIFDDVRYQVVGLAREIAMPSLDGARNDLPEFYTPFRPGGSYVALSVKCTTACPTVPELQRRLSATAAGVRTLRPEIPDVVFQKELERPRSAALLGGLFAVIAVLTAAGGLFSVLSFGVNRRKRELGIRAALGASAASIRRLVLLDGARTAALGLVIGGTASWFLARALASLQYGVSRRDPETWLAVVGIIALTTLAACWLPARRAGEADVAGLMRDG